MTFVILSIALSLIWEATKYVSNSESVLQLHMRSVEKKFEYIHIRCTYSHNNFFISILFPRIKNHNIPVQKWVRLSRQGCDVTTPSWWDLETCFTYQVGGEQRPIWNWIFFQYISNFWTAPYLWPQNRIKWHYSDISYVY